MDTEEVSLTKPQAESGAAPAGPPEEPAPYDFDVFVIGGGSGGLALAKEAAGYGARVGIADYVKPSPKGTSWGLGGTCVNVGCIPKKLMHFSALTGETFADAKEAGWGLPDKIAHSWERMKANVAKYIKKLNWGYKTQLMEKGVKYFNNYASFLDAHTILLAGTPEKKVTANVVVIAVGGRPNYESIKGAKEYAITSDDLFWLDKSPGKTLVVGASYVALECAGFLTNMGCDTTLMVRSIFLRGYDQDMANRIGGYMEAHGTKIYRPAIPLELSKSPNGKINVHYKMMNNNTEKDEEFDTVLLAIGRKPVTAELNLEKAGLKAEESGKIVTNEYDQTSVENIYAIGDVSYGKPELTPVAIMAGKLLAARMMGVTEQLMDYTIIPSTVYTPIEYGFCGMTEDDAIKKYGKDEVLVYHSSFKPLEWNFLKSREEDVCYVKILVEKSTDKVIGYHYLGPNAGEVTQGYAVAMKMGVTKQQWDATVRIHPTCSEEMLSVEVVKGSGKKAAKSGC